MRLKSKASAIKERTFLVVALRITPTHSHTCTHTTKSIVFIMSYYFLAIFGTTLPVCCSSLKLRSLPVGFSTLASGRLLLRPLSSQSEPQLDLGASIHVYVCVCVSRWRVLRGSENHLSPDFSMPMCVCVSVSCGKGGPLVFLVNEALRRDER